eukprot:4294244-Karenia_brevis.AAC.1
MTFWAAQGNVVDPTAWTGSHYARGRKSSTKTAQGITASQSTMARESLSSDPQCIISKCCTVLVREVAMQSETS